MDRQIKIRWLSVSNCMTVGSCWLQGNPIWSYGWMKKTLYSMLQC